MKRIYFLVVLWLCFSCQEEQEVAITKRNLAGYVQKGPFINGTSITIAELSPSWVATGKIFLTQVADNQGSFSAANIELRYNFVQSMATGYYFDEVKGDKSSGPLTLYALVEVSDKSILNINLLSQLTYDRTLHLIRKGMSFADAKKQAQQEVLSIFGIVKEDMVHAESLDISKEGEDNAILLAISAILQANNTVAELSELLANIITDIREDGKLDSESNKEKIRQQAMSLNLSKIRAHLLKRYQELGVQAAIANFEKYIDSDGDGILNKDEDDTPDEFSFSAQKDIAVNTKVTSEEMTITGLKAAGSADAFVQQGQLIVNNITFTDSLVKVKNGDKIKLMLTSSSQYADTVVASLTIGYLTSYFTVVTDDYKADAFSFAAQKDIAVDSLYTSHAITVSGLPYPTPATVENGTLIKNGVELQTDSTTVKNGDTLAIKLRSSDQYAAATSATLDINGITAAFEVTTDDYKPDDFSFIAQKDVAVDSLYVSNIITLSGLPYPTPASIENGILIKNGIELKENIAKVKDGDQIAIKLLSSNQYFTATFATLIIGKSSVAFNITTDDYIPDRFSFTSVENAKKDSLYVSNTITLSGLPYPTLLTIEPGTLLILNGQELNTTTLMVKTGDEIALKVRASNQYTSTQSGRIVIGNLAENFHVTTMADPWHFVANLPYRNLTQFAAFVLNDKLYLGTGMTYNYLKDFYEFDPVSKQWTKKADFPGKFRFNGTAFSANGYGYMGAGAYETTTLFDMYKYNPSDNSWIRINGIPQVNTNYANLGFSLTLHDKVYSIAAYSTNTSFLEYDLSSDAWSQKAICPFQGASYTFAYEDEIYVGLVEGNAALWKYSLANNQWTKVANYPTDIVDPKGFLFNDKLYLLGSSSYANQYCYTFDMKSHSWQKNTFYRPIATVEYICIINGKGYAILNGDLKGDDGVWEVQLWEFTPPQP